LLAISETREQNILKLTMKNLTSKELKYLKSTQMVDLKYYKMNCGAVNYSGQNFIDS